MQMRQLLINRQETAALNHQLTAAIAILHMSLI